MVRTTIASARNGTIPKIVTIRTIREVKPSRSPLRAPPLIHDNGLMMVNKKKKKREAELRRSPELDPESQGAEVMTVAWMISILSVAACDFGAGVTRLLLGPDQKNLALLAGILYFAALTIGIISLVLLPIMLKARRVPPPRGLVVFGIAASVMPWIALVAQLILG